MTRIGDTGELISRRSSPWSKMGRTFPWWCMTRVAAALPSFGVCDTPPPAPHLLYDGPWVSQGFWRCHDFQSWCGLQPPAPLRWGPCPPGLALTALLGNSLSCSHGMPLLSAGYWALHWNPPLVKIWAILGSAPLFFPAGVGRGRERQFASSCWAAHLLGSSSFL